MEKVYQAPEAIIVEFEEKDLLEVSVGSLQVNDSVDPTKVTWNF